ncbi:hypothetical protein HAX54_049191 [Datura stramonium]|uniref:Secreted protein n=1 Tax=Datura stramonium TaxID=4076 RepID=A0ABS8RQZ5_DATST|nr:hypothetical protein [Datura stramonium]
MNTTKEKPYPFSLFYVIVLASRSAALSMNESAVYLVADDDFVLCNHIPRGGITATFEIKLLYRFCPLQPHPSRRKHFAAEIWNGQRHAIERPVEISLKPEMN